MARQLFSANVVFFVFLTLVCGATGAFAGEGAVEVEVARLVKVGMTSDAIEQIVTEKRPGEWWNSCASLGRGSTPPTERYPLDDQGTNLLVGFGKIADPNGNIGNGDKATSISVVRFDDLKREFPAELFPAIRLIHLSPSPEEHFDPPALIRAVNGLMPLGKEKALKALREYERVAHYADRASGEREFKYWLDEQRIFLILRLLFVRADGKAAMPEMMIGAAASDAVTNEKDTPLFPLMVEGDIPFCLCRGYNLGGVAQNPEEHIDFCEKNCVMRKEPLRPAGSPLTVAERAFSSERWKRIHPDGADSESRYLLREQALRCVNPLLEKKPGLSAFHPNCVSREVATGVWRKYLDSPVLRGARWDEKGERFVGGKGRSAGRD